MDNPKTTRRWGISPNHQTQGSDLRAVAERDRQVFAGNQAALRGLADTPPQPQFTPIERIAASLGHLAESGVNPGLAS